MKGIMLDYTWGRKAENREPLLITEVTTRLPMVKKRGTKQMCFMKRIDCLSLEIGGICVRSLTEICLASLQSNMQTCAQMGQRQAAI